MFNDDSDNNSSTNHYGVVPALSIAKIVRTPMFQVDESAGKYNLLPSRPVSAQFRLFNKQYDLPEDKWTINPETPPWKLSVQAGHRQFAAGINDFTVQPMFMSVQNATQAQSSESLFNKIKHAVFSAAGMSING